MKRWLAGAVLGLAAAGGMVTPGVAQAGSGAWSQAYQASASGSFGSIAAISASNIWAAGDTYTVAGKTIYQPFVRHFNGKSWQAITIPGASGATADWVTASAAGSVWVGGLKNGSPATTVMYRWNGTRWGKVPMPARTVFQGAIALGPDNVWAFGSSGTVDDDFFHWNGTKWQYYLADTANFIAQGISASGSNNVWVSGYEYSGSKQKAAAYRWNGRAWSAVSMPHPVLPAGGPGVTAVSTANVWIGWQGTATAEALHWDGHQWHTVTTPTYADASGITPDGKGGYWFGPRALLTGSTWTSEQLPGFEGQFGGVTRIPGTTSFLLNAGVIAGTAETEEPTIFRFDL